MPKIHHGKIMHKKIHHGGMLKHNTNLQVLKQLFNDIKLENPINKTHKKKSTFKL